MPISCPHTHRLEHTLNNPEQSGADIQKCIDCHGVIKYCPHCEHANRLAARYCVECGTQLTIPTSTAGKLLRPGEIRQAAQAPSHYPLDNSLKLSEGHRPFMWFSAQEGLLVLTKNRADTRLPLALHFIPGYRFDTQASILISNQFPSYSDWIQKPLLSQLGLFIATENELQYFPTHGYDSIFAPQHWQPLSGYKIRAIALDEEGEPLILVSDNNNNLQLLLGNAQKGQWGEKKIELEKPVDDGGYAIAVGKAVPELYAIYDGTELLLVDLKSASIQQQLKLPETVKLHRLFSERSQTPYFEPFLMGAKGNSLRCIIPVKCQNETLKAGVVRFEDSQHATTKTEVFPIDTWFLPDPWGLGFTVWSEKTVLRYEGHQPSWQDDGGKFSLVEPLLTPSWFVGQAQTVSGSSYSTEGTEILVLSASQVDDRYNINLECRVTLSNVEGGKVAGMPPIQSNGRIFIALREIHNDPAAITVYTMQIAR